jgi:AcrR family transcriptional regulator
MRGMTESAKTTSKRQRAVEAGARVFLRFGYARTTMGDIAQAADMSRPALYLLFCSKEEVFEAVVDQWIKDSLVRIAAGLADHATLAEKLRFACEVWCVEGLERALANPEVRDMSGLPAVRQSYARFETCLTEILQEAVDRSALGLAAGDLARVIVSAMQGFKQTARSSEEMRHLIAVQISAIDRALSSCSQSSLSSAGSRAP